MPARASSYTVVGVSCDDGVRSITAEVSKTLRVTGVDVDLAAGLLTVTSDGPVDEGAVIAAVADAGYEVAQ
jgi:copper chaperone